MTEYTKSKLERIKAQYNELVQNHTFNETPFNLLSDSDRVLFATNLVESQDQYDRDQEMVEQHRRIISKINKVYRSVD